MQRSGASRAGASSGSRGSGLHSCSLKQISPAPLILITNDDGIDSPGLLALKRVLEPLGRVVVVAPDRNRTGAARSITMHAPLWIEEVELADGSVGFATNGTPVDCVRTAALGFLERPPDLILAGINLGGNLGDDITYSGTVAAALEGIMLDTPAIAVSAEGYRAGYDLDAPAACAASIVRSVLTRGFPGGTVLNVNIPPLSLGSIRGVQVTRLGRRVYADQVQVQQEEGRRKAYLMYGDELGHRPEAGTDFEAVAAGFVSVTPIHFDLTAHDVLATLQALALSERRVFPSPTGGEAAPLAPRPRAVVFDLDGTLVDSVDLIVESFRHATRSVLGKELPREELIAGVGKPLQEQMELVDRERADELVRAYREFNHREHDRMLRLYAGVDDLLRRLRQAGIRVGLVTSKSRPVTQMAFDTTGIDSLLEATVCAHETERNKPHPDPLLYCLELLSVEPGQACYVGDSPYDLQAARAAGVRSVAVAWGVFDRTVLEAEGPDRLVGSVEELERVLGL